MYPKNTIIDKIASPLQEEGSSQNKRGYFVVWPKVNVMISISGKNVFVLPEITLVLEETSFLNEYRSLVLVLQPEVLNFYRVKIYTWLISCSHV